MIETIDEDLGLDKQLSEMLSPTQLAQIRYVQHKQHTHDIYVILKATEDEDELKEEISKLQTELKRTCAQVADEFLSGKSRACGPSESESLSPENIFDYLKASVMKLSAAINAAEWLDEPEHEDIQKYAEKYFEKWSKEANAYLAFQQSIDMAMRLFWRHRDGEMTRKLISQAVEKFILGINIERLRYDGQ